MYLVGKRGRDAEFRSDGTLSIWTVGGRKRLPYIRPPAFRATFDAAVEIDSITVIERDGRLLGRVVVTLAAPVPAPASAPDPDRAGAPDGTRVVGVDLNETNALVAVDGAGRELFI